MAIPSPHLYHQEARELGVDSRTLGNALAVMRAVGGGGATPVFTLNHLAQLTGASHRYLHDIVARDLDPYLDISRPKRDGRTRSISSPEPVLMEVQRWILQNVLTSCAPHDASFAYQRGRSVLGCAAVHAGARWLVKLDIHNFFTSIREQRVFPIFAGLGYPRLLSLELTRICTRVHEHSPHYRSAYRDGVPYQIDRIGALPQGAPTSGALANLAMRNFDSALAGYAEARGFAYTRYSDDIVLSSGGDFSRARASAAIGRIGQALDAQGLSIHQKKTRVIPPGARKVVLGLLVDGDRPRLLPEFKRRIEVHVRGVQKFGLPSHAKRRRFDSILSMINHVDGCIAFAGGIEEEYAETVAGQWAEALRSSGYPR